MAQIFYTYLWYYIELIEYFQLKKDIPSEEIDWGGNVWKLQKALVIVFNGGQRGMKTELNGSIGKAQLRLILWNFLHFFNKVIKYITKICD